MTLDLPTLMAAGSFVAAMSAVFIFFAWQQSRDGRALLWWAAGDLFYAAGLVLLVVGTIPGYGIMRAMGGIVCAVAPALFWTSARRFDDRPPPYLLILVALLLPVAMLAFRASYPSLEFAVTLAVIAAMTAATAWEFWRGREDGLKARWPLVGLCLLQCSVFVAGAIEVATGRVVDGPVPLTSWFGSIHFVSVLFSLGTAVFIVALSRERSVSLHKRVAETDDLTGMLNRGALMSHADEALRKSSAAEKPMSVILFDLDNFKSINDRFGHAAGDDVLRQFGKVVSTELRPTDRVGRIGGEEFVVVLPQTSLAEAFALAERIRETFAVRCASLDGLPVKATVSAGVTTARPRSSLDALLAAADDGLYLAKQNGRNRVERPRRGPDDSGGLPLEQVA
ncbi:GGDEF domain-containing protein [Bauldia litoralis]|uniref:GGDEF domain-containing protein n=1 Tax=Bauldia litoralis TaxID=665467 RepID=UPI0032660CF5